MDKDLTKRALVSIRVDHELYMKIRHMYLDRGTTVSNEIRKFFLSELKNASSPE